MDAFFIVLYVQGSLRRGQILYYTDAQNMIGLLQDHGIFAKWLAGMSFTLHLSIIVSCLLLLAGRKSGVYLGLLQIPFRLMFMVPSISILLVWAKLSPAYSLWLMLVLVIASEVVKAGSLWWLLHHQRAKFLG
ncbi:hypothetical protein D3C81_833330 [compost metagenome]|uniref:Uncharacterized protein n=2 Tax=Pseudomonas TaxID=286 RepID=A0A380T6L1_9PSED|nr:hypothetical protein [Pseudomonas wadenswilerensis]UVM22390.1 hypothetical protein LOY45_02145 [Pseudomonas wadenswilerensis]SUQ65605.1 hypothetical protein CCOS864_05082 [Pseudomonas wadenswilerensis]